MRKAVISVVVICLLIAVGMTTAEIVRPKSKKSSRRVTAQPVVFSKYGPEAKQQLAADIAAERARQLAEDRGTTLRPAKSAAGDNLKLQQEFVALFNKLAPVPDARTAYFSWLDTPEFGLRGWHGEVLMLEETDDGHLFKVRISPYLVSTRGNVTDTTDYFIEIYHYTGDQLTYVGSEGPVPGEERLKMILID
jgi:hypothetical protein